MAGKRKESTTIPQKWEDVPEIPKEEHPYPLPEGWKWVYLGDAIQLLRGVSYSKEDAHKYQHKDDYLILRGGNIKEGYIDFNASDNIYINKNLIKDDQLIKKNDIVIVSSTGSIKVIGRAGIADKNCNDVAFGAFLTLARPNKYFNSRYVDYFFQSDMYRSRIRKLVKGININNIKNEYIALTPFPAPPLETQRRIVSHVESFFSKLDEAAEKVQAVIDSHEARKQAILHKAFSGELTKKWREVNGVSLDSWEEKNLIDICTIKSGTTIDKSEELESGKIPYIKVADMNLPENNLEIKTSSRFVNKINNSNPFPKNCIIFPKRGGAIFTNKKRLVRKREILADLNIMAIIPNENKIALMFLYYWFLTIDLSTLNNGTNVPQINNKDFIPIKIKIPSKYEQNILIQILEHMLDNEWKLINNTYATITKINNIKKYILSNIFKGGI